MRTENLSTLKIHKLTQEQYERELLSGRLDENALYLTPDSNNCESIIYKQNDEPTDAPEGSLWVDLDASGRVNAGNSMINIDQTLTVEGYAADAKAVGDAICNVKTEVKNYTDAHANRTDNPHNVTAAQVGLGNVTNTSDMDKPVSTAQAEAIADAKKAGTDAQTSADNALVSANAYTNEHVKKAAPRNLLDNSDFTNPVNQWGATSATAYRYFIDRWYIGSIGNGITLTPDGIKVDAVGHSSNPYLRQYTETLPDGDYTVVAHMANGFTGYATFSVNNGAVSNVTRRNPPGLYFNLGFANGLFEATFTLLGSHTEAVTISALALYKGTYTDATLPEYQPKGYENELLVCRQYNPTTGEYIGLRKFSQPHNLLDNSDFRNPVNQRGLTSYTGRSYSIDRWIASASTKVTVNDGYITVQNTASSGRTSFEQILPKNYIGKTLTIAVCEHDTQEIYCKSTTIPNATTSNQYVGAVDFNGHTARFNLTSGSVLTAHIMIANGSSVKLDWMAVYEGEYTTETIPAYQPKGYAAELAECQRYFYSTQGSYFYCGYGSATSTTEFFATMLVPVKMRVIPTVSNASDFIARGAGKEHTLTLVGVAQNTANGISMSFTSTNLVVNEAYILRTTGTVQFSADL